MGTGGYIGGVDPTRRKPRGWALDREQQRRPSAAPATSTRPVSMTRLRTPTSPSAKPKCDAGGGLARGRVSPGWDAQHL